MNPIFTKIIDKADVATAAPDDYINPDDGLKYCGKCRIANEAFFTQTFRHRASPSTRLCVSVLPSAVSVKKRSAGNMSECPT